MKRTNRSILAIKEKERLQYLTLSNRHIIQTKPIHKKAGTDIIKQVTVTDIFGTFYKNKNISSPQHKIEHSAILSIYTNKSKSKQLQEN